ncbi:MAG: hypothetical protein ACK52U_15305, partial [Synechococcaceae cyanobacterium]
SCQAVDADILVSHPSSSVATIAASKSLSRKAVTMANPKVAGFHRYGSIDGITRRTFTEMALLSHNLDPNFDCSAIALAGEAKHATSCLRSIQTFQHFMVNGLTW